jgi:N-acetylglucosaminyldiphosphoundecaprenol N-acetyl-beta-D-mannosaminyltransferase
MTNRVSLFGVQVDPLRMAEAVDRVWQIVAEPQSKCQFVVTPNVDHVVLLEHSPGLRDAYRQAALVLADGWPVVMASRWLGKRLPERVAGSDLVPHVFDQATADRPLTAYLLGALPGVAERAAANIHARWPHVRVVGCYSPPLGFEKNEAENEQILARLHAAQADVLVLGLGAPKQELWIAKHHPQVSAKIALCVGATIDFLAGERKRAPRWVQAIGLEWFYRMAGEPRRLVSRYARDAWVFPQIVWREWRGESRTKETVTA